MIHERLMAQGSFDIPLKADTPWTIWETTLPHGHVVVFPQYIDARQFDDADLLAMARYSGVLLDKQVNTSGMRLGGAGMVWWLGDEEGKGRIYQTAKTLTSSTLANALTQLLPANYPITSGTVTEAAANYTGTHHFQTPLDAIRTVCATVQAEFRVNPDATIDAGYDYDVYNINDPSIVVVRQGDGGGTDPNYTGIPSNFIEGRLTAREYATSAILVETAADGTQTLADSASRNESVYNMQAAEMLRTYMTDVPSNAGSYGQYVEQQLAEHITRVEEKIRTDFYEIASGDWRVGDAYHVYDPPHFVDTSNEVWFRGDVIFPKKLRMVEADWTIRKRMGVYYRSPAYTPVWTDLTPYVAEELSDSIGILTEATTFDAVYCE